jgi:predicted TIM-barrel fold metal-dependent hydrolase
MVDHAWTVESLRPYVLKAIDLFGPARCLFASNFPVDGLHATYGAVWRTWAEIVVGASADEQHALFGGNAERVYRL